MIATADGILVDPICRAMLARLEREPGLSVSELARPFPLKLAAIMKHLGVLADAGLVSRSKTGRTVSVELTPTPMQEAMEWLQRYERFWSKSIGRLVEFVEGDEK
jgi:DNA-binding transcriptional ArsR family regulator